MGLQQTKGSAVTTKNKVTYRNHVFKALGATGIGELKLQIMKSPS